MNLILNIAAIVALIHSTRWFVSAETWLDMAKSLEELSSGSREM